MVVSAGEDILIRQVFQLLERAFSEAHRKQDRPSMAFTHMLKTSKLNIACFLASAASGCYSGSCASTPLNETCTSILESYVRAKGWSPQDSPRTRRSARPLEAERGFRSLAEP